MGIIKEKELATSESNSDDKNYVEFKGEIGDRYADAEGNEFVVRGKVKGGVTIKGKGGEKEIDTNSLLKMKKLNESKVEDIKKSNPALWHQIQIAKKTVKMNPVGVSVMGGMSMKEAEELLDKHGIKYEKTEKVKESNIISFANFNKK